MNHVNSTTKYKFAKLNLYKIYFKVQLQKITDDNMTLYVPSCLRSLKNKTRIQGHEITRFDSKIWNAKVWYKDFSNLVISKK